MTRAHTVRGRAAAALVLMLLGVLAGSAAGAATLAPVNGQGSTYAALAFQTWTQASQVDGLNVNYTATGSPSGLQAFQQNTADFAGTEAEYSELYAGTGGTANAHVSRGFAYTPDVAGAIAIMYHVAINADGSDPVTYLHLSRLTVAKIFLGVITNWDSPTISQDNKGLVLPNKPITIDYRTGQSGTTALFYDFVKQTDPTDFTAWAQANKFPTSARVWEVDDGQAGFPPPGAQGYSASDQQAQAVAGQSGLWSIGYDEFGYAKVYNDDVAWIENAAGQWVQPYAQNIAAALQSAVLAPDTSQTLDGVYTSTTPLAYPISAYSYILYQCATTPTRPTCKGPYSNTGVMNTLAKFMRYVACTGQVKMATIGYSPLPMHLSQFMANAVGYMTGSPPETLSAANCANPQFQGGSLGVGAKPPPDPTASVASEGHGPGAGAGQASSGSTTGTTAASGPASTGSGTSGSPHGSNGPAGSGGVTAMSGPGQLAAVGVKGAAPAAVGGGSGTALTPQPVDYVGPAVSSGSPMPLIVLAVMLLIAVTLLSIFGHRRRSSPPVAAEAGRSGIGDGDQGELR